MNLLHVCSITNNKASGISQVVPEHFINQKKYENVTLINCNHNNIEKLNEVNDVYKLRDVKKNKSLKELFDKQDLVIFHGVYFMKYIKIYNLLKKKNIPYIIIPHGSLTKNAQNKKKLKKIIFNKVFFNKFIYNALSIQYLSNSELEMSKTFKINSFVLGNGINDTGIIKKKNMSDNINLIYVGRYAVFHKGLDILLDACKIAYNEMLENKIKINLYGSGDDGFQTLINMVKERNLEDVVKVHDSIFDQEKIKKIIKNDAFIQISRSEGQPLGIMEAMMLGMPIIASKGTTFGEIVKENECGFLCSTKEEVANILKKIPREKEKLEQMGINSRVYALENFLWSNICIKTLNKYKELIKND